MYSFKNEEFDALLDMISMYHDLAHNPSMQVSPETLGRMEVRLGLALKQVYLRHQRTNARSARNIERYRRENPEYLRGKKAIEYAKSQE